MAKVNLSNTFICLIVLFFALSMRVSGQNSTLKGVVKDVDGIPLIGVNVVEKGTTNGTVTDIDGNFSINVKTHSTVIFTYIGFAEQELVWDGMCISVWNY